MYAVWLRVDGAPLHALSEILFDEEPRFTTYRGTPAVLVFVDDQARCAEIRQACQTHDSCGVRNIEVLFDEEPAGV